jgi:hypothetical protein
VLAFEVAPTYDIVNDMNFLKFGNF